MEILKKVFVAILIIVVIAGIGIGSSFVYDRYIKDNIKPPIEENPPPVDGDGNELNSDKVYAMPTQMTFRSASSQGYTIKATVNDPYGNAMPDEKVDWNISFVNPNDVWSQNKTASDYITVTPTADGSTTATVKCVSSFGSQIQIVCSSRSNENAEKAICKLDFAQKIKSTTLKLFDETIADGATKTYDLNYSRSIEFYDTIVLDTIYSKKDTIDIDRGFELNENYRTYIEESEAYSLVPGIENLVNDFICVVEQFFDYGLVNWTSFNDVYQEFLIEVTDTLNLIFDYCAQDGVAIDSPLHIGSFLVSSFNGLGEYGAFGTIVTSYVGTYSSARHSFNVNFNFGFNATLFPSYIVIDNGEILF